MGLNVAIINAGSVFGGLFAGQLCDHFGRKWGIAVSAFFTIIAVAVQASATHGMTPTLIRNNLPDTDSLKEAAFCIGRFFLGISITVNGCAAPVWVMEMSHPKNRGFMGGMYMAIWYLAAVVVSGISLGTYYYDSTWAWRGLSIVSTFLLFFPPEMLTFIRDKSYLHFSVSHYYHSCQKVHGG